VKYCTSTTKPSATTYEGRSAGRRTRSLLLRVGVGSFGTTLYGCNAGLVFGGEEGAVNAEAFTASVHHLAHDLDDSRV
jgi:hypothetical protein